MSYVIPVTINPNQAIIQELNTNYDYNSNPLIISNIAAINNEIYNILSTRPGERPFEPTFGCFLADLIFEPLVPMTAFRIRNEIFGALLKWEPRITVIQSQTSVTILTNVRGWAINVVYYVPNLQVNGSTKINYLQG